MNCKDYYYNEPHYHFLKQHSVSDLKKGDILYFYMMSLDREWEVWFGSIAEIYSDGVCLTLYSPNLHKKVSIDGVDYYWEDAPDKTLPIKLPKTGKKRSQIIQGAMKPIIFYENNEYATKLTKEFYQKDFLSNKQRIKEMIEQELIIPNEKIDWSYYDEFFLDKDMLIYAKKYLSYQSRYYAFQTNERTLSWDKIFLTYEEANQYIMEMESERARKKGLTDSEITKEETAIYVTKYINLYLKFKDVELCKEVHRKIMDNIEKILVKLKIDWNDFEIRLYGGSLEYRKVGNAKWNNLTDNIDENFLLNLDYI